MIHSNVEKVNPTIERVKSDVMDLLDRGLSKDLCFHNKEHTLGVYESAKRYAELEGISSAEKRLLLMAALFHDTGFTKQYENNEPIGVEIAEAMLPQYGYSPQDIKVVTGIILATKMPQKPRNHLQQIICDVDLDHLGRDGFFKKGELLRKEWAIFLKRNYSDREWYKLQIDFLESHQYFTASARNLRDAGVLKNIERLGELRDKSE